VPIREQLRAAPCSTHRPRLASTGLSGPHCVDQAFPNYPVLGTIPKLLALTGYMEVSTPRCGRGSYIIPLPLLDKCWKPPPTLLAFRKSALKNLLR